MPGKHVMRAAISVKNLTAMALSLLACTGLMLRCEANPAARAHFQRGLELSMNNQWAKAEAAYRAAIALDPKNATYPSYLADALAAQGKFKQAKTTNQKSDTLKKTYPQSTLLKSPRGPTNARPAINKPRRPGSGTLTSGKPSTGKPSSTTRKEPPGLGNPPPFPLTPGEGETPPTDGNDGPGFTIPPSDGDFEVSSADETEPNFLKGQDYMDEGKWPQAEAAFRSAIKAKPTSAESRRGLGDALFKQGKWKEAEKAHREAVRLKPDEGYYHAQLAADLLQQGRRDEATQAAQEAIRQGWADHEVFDELGLATR